RLAVSTPPVTRQQLRDVEFDAVPVFVDREKALDRHANRFAWLDSMIRVTILTLGMSKLELIERVATDQETGDTILKDLGEAIEEAKMLLSLVEAARWRTAVALTNVCDE